MSSTRPVAAITCDNADTDGRVNLYGFQYTWPFTNQRQTDTTNTTDFLSKWDLDPNGDYAGRRTEIVGALNILKLRQNTHTRDMVLADWTPSTIFDGVNSDWREEQLVGAKYLCMPHSAIQFGGGAVAPYTQFPTILSNRVFAPRWVTWHRIPAPGNDPTTDGTATFENPSFRFTQYGATIAYSIYVPTAQINGPPGSDPRIYPQLERGVPDGAGGWTWTVVDEWVRPDTRVHTPGSVLQGDRDGGIIFEVVDGQVMIRMEGVAEPWLYDPGSDSLLPQPGPIEVKLHMQAFTFNLQQVEYYNQGKAAPQAPIDIPAWMNPTANYSAVISPRGSSCGLASLVTVAEGSIVSGQNQPLVSLQRGTDGLSPIVYFVRQVNNAVYDAGYPRIPLVTTIGADAEHALKRLTYKRTFPFDWCFTAELYDGKSLNRETDNVMDGYYARNVKLNGKTCVYGGFDVRAADLPPIMVGYTTTPKARIDDDLVRHCIVEGRGYVMARLAGKKYMDWTASPEGQDLGVWLYNLLSHSGVPDACINIGSTDTDHLHELGIVCQKPQRKSISWLFAHDTELLEAIKIVTVCYGLTLIETPTGVLSLFPILPQYVPGTTAVFTLDETQAAGDEIYELESETDAANMRNAIALFSGEGLNAETAFWQPSINDRTSPLYIGEYWWTVATSPDTSTGQLTAQNMLDRALFQQRIIRWTRTNKLSIMPGTYVQCNIYGLGFPYGSVFQVMEDQGEFDADSFTARSTHLARLVYTPT